MENSGRTKELLQIGAMEECNNTQAVDEIDSCILQKN